MALACRPRRFLGVCAAGRTEDDSQQCQLGRRLYGQRKNDAESRTRKCHSIPGIERYNFHTVSDDVEFLRIDEGIASARI
uniref:Uncharacterized protein n=1 Tax=Oryza sativa subsp. japonica TaxID=39947 RepID=Q2QQE4_ORYSJ|nr:hypothetical protein LOC_Os12g31330 [Oryza sativa Japonica Group]